jgi:hypothetical protein
MLRRDCTPGGRTRKPLVPRRPGAGGRNAVADQELTSVADGRDVFACARKVSLKKTQKVASAHDGQRRVGCLLRTATGTHEDRHATPAVGSGLADQDCRRRAIPDRLVNVEGRDLSGISGWVTRHHEVVDERAPAEGIRRHRAALDRLSDEELIERLCEMPPLPQVPDEDLVWADDATWERAELLIAFADAIGDRQLIAAIGPLYEHAALGDAFEMMQGIRHGPERAVAPDWDILVEIMKPLVRHSRAGCRRWAIRELGLLRDVATIPVLMEALTDVEPWVRQEVCKSLHMVAEAADLDTQAEVRNALVAVSEEDESEMVREEARWASGDGA